MIDDKETKETVAKLKAKSNNRALSLKEDK